MAARLRALPAISLSAVLPLLHGRSSFPTTAGKSLSFRRFSSRPVARSSPLVEVSAQARRGFSFQEDDFASTADLCFESPLKIVEYPDPILRATNKRINTFDENLKKLVEEMFDLMYKTDGIGLSAPQVGISVQLMVFNPAGERGEGEQIVLVNPVVYKTSKRTILYNEGCLSFPEIYADVERPASVKVGARDITGGRFKVNLSGLPARVFQHEFDHLQGTLFFDRMTEDVLESIRSDLKALEMKYESRTGLPSPESIDQYERRKEVAGFART
ncbi:peptide deformylase 1B, chloroplastic [Phoenix dactylifera]|uniref:Peptide deformylase n=1 Tax=Phoenix dactylifera TaxID=42345 RepID=A0A8B7CJR6_PHODC|nr:peptide deformylase 1B, chloroplastic [Phoenix dactylifera]